MADDSVEKSVDQTEENQSLSDPFKEIDGEPQSNVITEEHCSEDDSKDVNMTEKSDIENSKNDACSEEISGFLRSFTEKKQSSQSTDYLENGQDKVESTREQSVKETSLCLWQECDVFIGSRSKLSQHVHQAHVEPMTEQDVFVCLWKGCKVFNKPSCSHSWLSKHMNSHTGDKAFKCMIDGCTMSFSSCEGLSRHVAAHFHEPKPSKRQRGEPKESPKKHPKKKKQKAVKRQQPTEVKEDFVNSKTVETIKKKLPCMMPLCYEIGIDGNNIVLHSNVLGKRINEDNGETDLLLHWTPDDLLPDEWIPQDNYEQFKTKVIHISTLPNHIAAELDPAFYRRMSYRTHPRK